MRLPEVTTRVQELSVRSVVLLSYEQQIVSQSALNISRGSTGVASNIALALEPYGQVTARRAWSC